MLRFVQNNTKYPKNKNNVLKRFKMTKEEKEYVLTALHFALDNGDFIDEDIETAYNSLNNSITVIEKEFVSEGWTKIESEDDLPKEYDAFNIILSFNGDELIAMNVPHKNGFIDFDKQLYPYNAVSHYQPIQKPEPPLY